MKTWEEKTAGEIDRGFYRLCGIVSAFGLSWLISIFYACNKEETTNREIIERHLSNTRIVSGYISDMEMSSFSYRYSYAKEDSEFPYTRIILNTGEKIIIPYQSPDIQKDKKVDLTYMVDPNNDGKIDFGELLKYGHAGNFGWVERGHYLEHLPTQKGYVKADGMISYKTLESTLRISH